MEIEEINAVFSRYGLEPEKALIHERMYNSAFDAYEYHFTYGAFNYGFMISRRDENSAHQADALIKSYVEDCVYDLVHQLKNAS